MHLFYVSLFLLLRFLPREDSFAFIVKLIWWCWILLTFACLESFWFFHSIWRRVLLSQVFLVVCFSLSLACRVCWEISCWFYGSSLVCCHFSLAAFNILSLYLILVSLITMCLNVFVLGTSWDSLCFQDLVDYFLLQVGDVFSYYLLKYFLRSFLSHLSFWEPYNENDGVFNVVTEGLLGSLHFFSLFFLYSFLLQWFLLFSPPSHLYVLLLQLFYYWFLLIYAF